MLLIGDIADPYSRGRGVEDDRARRDTVLRANHDGTARPGLRVLTVPLELNSRVRVATFCAASDPQELGGTTASLSPCEQSGSKVTSLIFVLSGSSRRTRGCHQLAREWGRRHRKGSSI